MAKAKIKANSRGILEALGSAGVVDALEDAVKSISDRAYSTAPVESGTYRDSIHTEMGQGDDRPVGYVVADAEHALVVEAKTNNLLKAALGGGDE